MVSVYGCVPAEWSEGDCIVISDNYPLVVDAARKTSVGPGPRNARAGRVEAGNCAIGGANESVITVVRINVVSDDNSTVVDVEGESALGGAGRVLWAEAGPRSANSPARRGEPHTIGGG